MTLEELVARERIRDTYARYNHAGDRGRIDDLAACFTDDGTLEIKGGFTATGRRTIIDSLTDISARTVRTDPPPAGAHHIVRHYVANLLFENLTPERAETVAYYAVFHVDGADHWGRYRDVLVPRGERWLFSRRRVTVDGKRAGSAAG